MAGCSTCGGSLRFLERLKGNQCDSCRRQTASTRAAARRRYGELVAGLVDGNTDPAQSLREIQETTALAAYEPADLVRVHGKAVGRLVDRLLADEVLSEQDEKDFEAITDALGLGREELAKVDRSILVRMCVAQANAGRLAELPAEDTTLMPKRGEAIHLEAPAAMMKEVVQREYRGGYGGVSFRIAKGVRFHTGGVRGKPVVVGTDLKVEDEGWLCVSSKRIVFVGQRKTIEMPLAKLVSLNVFTDGIQLHVSNRQRAPLFRTQDPELVAAVVNAAAQNLA